MGRDIESAVGLGASGIVLGVLDGARRVDVARTRALVEAARGTPVTFHRAIDETPDLLASVDALATLGVARILSSGGAPTASEGARSLRSMVERAGDGMTIVAGGGIRGPNAADVVRRTGAREVHARCGGDTRRIAAIAEALAHLG
jgi:copper homeostasis protein